MAWLSIGTSNEDLCNKMVEHGVLVDGIIQNAFRNTDRGDFVPEKYRSEAYVDRPFKQTCVHISAPHMYVTVIENLELSQGCSFLNVGSGSGYLSCLVAFIVGPTGLCHGVDINPEVVKHSKLCCERWIDKAIERMKNSDDTNHNNLWNGNQVLTDQNVAMIRDSISFVEGNCFYIDSALSIQYAKYDRIYVGAGCPDSHKEFFYNLLEPNGILIVPINETNRLMKITRTAESVFTTEVISSVTFAPLQSVANMTDFINESTQFQCLPDSKSAGDICRLLTDCSKALENVPSPLLHLHKSVIPVTNTISSNSSSFVSQARTQSGFTLSDLFRTSSATTTSSTSSSTKVTLKPSVKLPAVQWSPNRYRHKQYPQTFQKAVLTIMLCTRFANDRDCDAKCAKMTQQTQRTNTRCYDCLPSHIWIHIISFCNRDWFNPPVSALQLLATELVVEKKKRVYAEEMLVSAESARREAERERDLFKSVMVRMAKRSSYRDGTHKSGAGQTAALLLAGGVGHYFGEDDDEGDNEEENEEEEEEEEEDDEVDEDEDGGDVFMAHNHYYGGVEDEDMMHSDEEEDDNEGEGEVEHEFDEDVPQLPPLFTTLTDAEQTVVDAAVTAHVLSSPINSNGLSSVPAAVSSTTSSSSMMFIPETTATIMTPISLQSNNNSSNSTASPIGSKSAHVSADIPITTPTTTSPRSRFSFTTPGLASALSSAASSYVSGAMLLLSSSMDSHTTMEHSSSSSSYSTGNGVHNTHHSNLSTTLHSTSQGNNAAYQRHRRYSTISELTYDGDDSSGSDGSDTEIEVESGPAAVSSSQRSVSSHGTVGVGHMSMQVTAAPHRVATDTKSTVTGSSGRGRAVLIDSDDDDEDEDIQLVDGTDNNEDDDDDDINDHYWY